jgi:hypothetical protein
MSWLTRDGAAADAKTLVQKLEQKAGQKASTYLSSSDSAAVVRVAQERSYAAWTITRNWFFASIGVLDVLDDATEETYYLSKASNAYYFSELNVVPWTNWLGSLYVRLKDKVKRGQFPDHLEYGPPAYLNARSVGPLVEYSIADGRLDRIDYFFRDGQIAPLPKAGAAQPLTGEERQFGLKEIIRSIDIVQDDQIRGPMQGIFILIGGPGVGKTTVALHRIPYLINEQSGTPHPHARAPGDTADLFFTQKSTLVVVWKDHLVPYLQTCLNQLELNDVKSIHVEDWIASHPRPYIPMGVANNQYRVTSEEDDIAEAKLGLSESDIEAFITSGNPLADESFTRISDVIDKVTESVAESGVPFSFALDSRYRFTARGITSALDRFRSAIDGVEEDVTSEQKSRTLPEARRQALAAAKKALAKARGQVTALRAGEIKRLGDCYPKMLTCFYQSSRIQELVETRYGKQFAQKFGRVVEEQGKKRVISKVDRYVLLWIIYHMTQGSPVQEKACSALPEYSHILIDEAQYYYPVVLRLFARLAKAPNRSMTIVGDLEQKISGKAGLISWDAIGMNIPADNIRRLVTNYRWSRQVFRFLAAYREAANLSVTLQEPDDWPSGEGVRPDVKRFSNRGEELDWVVRSIIGAKGGERSAEWTMAVVVPDKLTAEIRDRIIPELKSCDVKARWAAGEDVKESVEQVIVTDFDSVVGLEFDFVCVVGCEVSLAEQSGKDALQRVWVAITRARQYVAITNTGANPLLDDKRFDAFR